MNMDTLKGSWTETKGKFQQAFGEFTNDDVEKMKGEANELIGEIQRKYGVTKEEAEARFEEFKRELQ